jgi:hypothetical protein
VTYLASGEFWDDVWQDTAKLIGDHVEAGRRHLLTEDTLRFAAVGALEKAGMAPEQMKIEWPMPELGHGKLDLLVTFDGGARAAIEFKFPRDARGPISPDTMTLGELLGDFHRVARLPVDQRWVVELLGQRLGKYLDRLVQRHPISWPNTSGGQFLVSGTAVAGLPPTARKALSLWQPHHDIAASCVVAIDVPGQLKLLAFTVDPLPANAKAEPRSDAGAVWRHLP